MEPTVLTRSEHPVSRKQISREALKVLYRLKDNGFEAYLAGGCVRDLLLGRSPKDFDVATNATPEQIRKCFSNCRLIGRRFRLAHVCFGPEVIEVATFRSNIQTEERFDSDDATVNEASGVIERDNVFGSAEEDAFRRDFTCNALFYNIADFSIIDFTGGLKDIEERKIHCIGDPALRYQEDPVRMIRAVRFAATLDLEIDESTYQPLLEHASLLQHASNARMYEEMLKFFNSGAAEKAFVMLRDTRLLDHWMPEFADWWRNAASEEEDNWVRMALQQMNKWKNASVKASPELLFALLLAPQIRALSFQPDKWIQEEDPIQDDDSEEAGNDPEDLESTDLEATDPEADEEGDAEEDLADSFDENAENDGPISTVTSFENLPEHECLRRALLRYHRDLTPALLIPRRIAFRVFDILGNQARFLDRNPKRVARFVKRPFFRDALVFFKFDCLVRQLEHGDLIREWTEDLKLAPPPKKRQRKPRRGGRRPRKR